MTPNRSRRAQELFELAQEREPSDRAKFLEQACGGDEEIRREAESLLASHEAASAGLLESGTADIPASMVARAARAGRSFPPGTRLGAYEIVSAIGAGGMGEVFRARDPKLQRNVAIKVLAQSLANDYPAVPGSCTVFPRPTRSTSSRA